MFVISKTHVGMVRTVNEDALLTNFLLRNKKSAC